MLLWAIVIAGLLRTGLKPGATILAEPMAL